jgi:hypothetical protein
MRRLLILPGMILALLVAPASSPAAGACKRLVDVGPTGSDPADAVAIRISGTSCRTAYRVIRSSLRSRDAPGSPLYAGYRCDQRFSSRTTCRRGARRVSFRLG